jgi:hypothetical protein
MGVSEEAFDTLLALGLVEPVAGAASPARAATATARPGKPDTRNAPADTNLFAAYSAFNTADGKGIDDVLADTSIASGAKTRPAASARSAPTGADSYQRLYHFFTDVIGNHLGLRGYVLQVKVEKAATLVELAALRDTLGAALLKAKGEITTRAILDQLDEMLAEMGVAPAR